LGSSLCSPLAKFSNLSKFDIGVLQIAPIEYEYLLYYGA
jgi:hypothetical protein